MANDDQKAKYFTGLDSFKHLEILYKKLEHKLPHNVNYSLTKSQVFIMTLMKLRLNHSFRELGYRFNLSERTVSKYFFKYLVVMYNNLKIFIQWPKREAVRMSMPETFRKNYGNKVVAIIDCFEIFCQKPARIDAAATFYSFYKHHHTVKYLICKYDQRDTSFIVYSILFVL